MARVAEHLAHRHGEDVEQGREDRGIVKHEILELRERGAIELHHRGIDPALERRGGVLAEVVVIFQVDRIDQQTQLDVRGAAPRGRHFGIQTRTSESSFSTSSGLAM